MASTQDAIRLAKREPRTEQGMVAIIGPLETCVGIYTKLRGEEIIKERTDEQGICLYSIEPL